MTGTPIEVYGGPYSSVLEPQLSLALLTPGVSADAPGSFPVKKVMLFYVLIYNEI